MSLKSNLADVQSRCLLWLKAELQQHQKRGGGNSSFFYWILWARRFDRPESRAYSSLGGVRLSAVKLSGLKSYSEVAIHIAGSATMQVWTWRL
jgi:hypothetical protein